MRRASALAAPACALSLEAMALPVPTVTIEEYVAAENASDVRHELIHGVIVAMSGGSERHSLLGGAVLAELRARLRKGPCRTYTGDQRIFVPATGLVAYPDVSVVCGPSEKAPKDAYALTNPSVLVEVLSPITAAFDRGAKWQHYQRLASLRAYVLVEQDAPRVEVYVRDEDRWIYTVYEGLEASAAVAPLGVALPLADLYEGLPPVEAPPAA